MCFKDKQIGARTGFGKGAIFGKVADPNCSCAQPPCPQGTRQPPLTESVLPKISSWWMDGWYVMSRLRFFKECWPSLCRLNVWSFGLATGFSATLSPRRVFLIFEIERLNFLIMRAELLSRTQRCFFLFLRVLWERGNAFHSLLYCYLMVSYHYEASVRYDLKAENSFK